MSENKSRSAPPFAANRRRESRGPRVGDLLLALATAGAFADACQSPFDSCEATKTCPVSGSGGVAGTSGSNAGGARASGGISAGGTSSNAGAAGMRAGGAAGASGSAGAAGQGGDGGSAQPCSAEGATECMTHASAAYRVCSSGVWTDATCADGKLCDTPSGTCKPIIAGCVGLGAGDGFCDMDTRRVCGPDLVTAIAETCPGRCNAGECSAPVCGDGKLENAETCDDGNTIAGDGCSPSCAWEPVDLKLGDDFGCALFADAHLKCWGGNANGQLGVASYDNLGDDPNELGANLAATLSDVTAFATGASHACAVSKSGTWCWGDNAHGRQLGTGSATPAHAPSPVALNMSSAPVALAAGANHTCALFADGSVRCWGDNSHGQLGQNTAQTSVPQQATDLATLPAVTLGVSSLISAGGTSSCALVGSNQLRCWGDNSMGQLAIGSVNSIGDSAVDPAPANAELGSGFAPVGATLGLESTCAWTAAGAAKCWGAGSNGQLGNGRTAIIGIQASDLGDALPSVPLSGSVVALAAGGRNTCALFDSGKIECWGAAGPILARPDFQSSSLGDSAGEMALLTPVDLGDDGAAKSIAVGSGFACALLRRGVIKCWGVNDVGQLGLGDSAPRGADPTTLGNALPETTLE